MRPTTGLIAVATALRVALDQPEPIITLVQRDAARSHSESPSAALSANGRYVAFVSKAQLASADVNRNGDIYVLDRAVRRVSLESLTAEGRASNHDSAHPGLSADGRFLVYETYAGSAEDEPEARHVVLRDRRDATLTVVSVDPAGEPATGWSGTPVISHTGRLVAFASTATNLAPGTDANGFGLDVYVYDAETRDIRRISVDSRGVQPSSGFSTWPSLSGDGRFAAFASSAVLDRVTAADRAVDARRRPFLQVYVRDTHLNVTRVVSTGVQGRPPDGSSWAPSISAGGRYVAFVSAATNLGAADRNGSPDVFIADLHTGVTELASRSARGGTANGPSSAPAVSSDGRFVAFQSEASDLVCAQRCAAEDEDINLLPDVFVLDRQTRTIVRVSRDVTGGWMEPSSGPALDAAGTVVAFSSRRPIDASDRTNDFDLFVRPLPPVLAASLR